MSVVMGQRRFTETITGKRVYIDLISPQNGIERVRYTCVSPKREPIEAARKTIRTPSVDACTGDSESQITAEINELKDLSHEHCVRFVDAYEANSAKLGRRIYILTSPFADTTLARILLGGFDGCKPNETPSLFRCLISGLNYIHGKGTIHMDVKPSNILFLRGHVYFTDFGASVKIPKPGDRKRNDGTPWPRTRGYCPPEAEAGGTPRTSADIFSLGAVFLECLTVCCEYSRIKKVKGADGEFSSEGDHGKLLEKTRDSVQKRPSESWSKFKLMRLLCQWMMSHSESQRPSAAAVSHCWMYADCLELPKPPCSSEECGRLGTFKSADEALQAALASGHWLAAELLCHAGADVNTRCNVQENEYWSGTGNLLHLAAVLGNIRFLNFLIDKCVDVNAADSLDKAPLHIAVKNGDEDMTKALLQRLAHINVMDRGGQTPLDLAYGGGHESIIDLLRAKGALEGGGVVCDGNSAEGCR